MECNDSTVKLFGASRDQILGHNPAEFSPEVQPDGQESIAKATEKTKLVLEGNPQRFEWQHINQKTKEPFFVDVSLSSIQLKDKVVMQAVVRDITKRKKNEAAILESEERYRMLFNLSRDAIMTLAPPYWKFTSANPATIMLFGSESEEKFLSKDPGDLSPERQPDKECSSEKFKRMIGVAMKEGTHFFEWEHKKLSGETFPTTVLLSKIELKGVPQLQATVRDISASKMAEQELRDAIEVKSEFISMVSHELRTPLTVILEGTKIVADGSSGKLNDRQKRYMTIVERNVERLGRLINDVLDVQKLEAGMMRFSMEKKNINESVLEIQEATSAVAKNNGLDVEIDLDKDMPKIKFDNDRIMQVLTNLISNAMKFTKTGKITIATKKGDNCVKVSVADTGVGIKEEDMSKLFGRFEQVLTGENWKPGGTGLGLSICREIINGHNGKIWAESEFEKGTTVSFILPMAERRGQ